MHSFSMRLAKYFYDKPLPKYLDPKTVLIYRPHPVEISLYTIFGGGGGGGGGGVGGEDREGVSEILFPPFIFEKRFSVPECTTQVALYSP
jgi:hypothetical protein